MWEPAVVSARWAPTIELRSNGLWADHVCEEPMRRWGLGLEAFGIAVPGHPRIDEATRGDVVPLGLDLEWETGPPTDGPGSPAPGGAYTAVGAVHGVVQVGSDTLAVDAAGARGHAWGPPGPWWAAATWAASHWPDRGGVAVAAGAETLDVPPDRSLPGAVTHSEIVGTVDGPGMAGIARRLVVLAVHGSGRDGVGWVDAPRRGS